MKNLWIGFTKFKFSLICRFLYMKIMKILFDTKKYFSFSTKDLKLKYFMKLEKK